MNRRSPRGLVQGAPVTLRDVASRADVHPSTASRALNPATRSMVNAATVERVLGAARELGYEPNSLARGLKMSRTFTVGVVIPDLTNPLFPPIVRGLEDGLGQARYTVVMGNTDNDAERERSILEAMRRRRVDGLVLATAQREYPILDELEAAGIPVVLVNRTAEQPVAPSLTVDDHIGIGLALRHLAGLGHRRIAHVAGTQTSSTGFSRYQAYVSWLESERIGFDPDLVAFAGSFQEEPGAEAFRQILDRCPDVTAVVAANDLIALGCYDVASERGLRVPEDLSVVGCNDIPFSDKFNPPMTTVHLPLYTMGLRASQLLLDVIGGRETHNVAIRLTPTLVVRESTAPPRVP